MKRADFMEHEYDRFLRHISGFDCTERKQLVTFVKWCLDNGFLDNLSDRDLEYFYSAEKYIDLPVLKNHGIAVYIDDRYAVGIDPADCFNKVYTCSILFKFPMSARDEKRLYKLLDNLVNRKTRVSREWFKTASECWHGEYFCNV